MKKTALSSALVLAMAAMGFAQESEAPAAPPAAESVPATKAEAGTTPPAKSDAAGAPAEATDAAAEQPKTEQEAEANERAESSLGPETLSDPDVAARIETEYPVEGEEWKEYPLGVLEMEMQEAVEDLSNGKPKPPALVTQPRILSRLDFMIAELEKKCSGSGSGNSGNKPAEKSTLRKGKMKEGEMRAVQKDGDRWANVSPKEREKILQSQNEGFPPGYEDVLADYFRKLAKSDKPAEKSTSDPAAETPPTGEAAKE